MNVKHRALKAAMLAIPMYGDSERYRERISDFQRGYMAGHARMTRHASKIIKAERAGKRSDILENSRG